MVINYASLANIIYNKILPKLNHDKISVFLGGASVFNKCSVRYKLNQELEQKRNINIYFPEYLFNEVFNINNSDFLSLESLLVESIHCTILCVESYGSIAELGAFTNHEVLRKHLIVILDKKFQHDKSFINLGPVRLLRKENKGAVIYHDFEKGNYVKLAKNVYTKANALKKYGHISYNLKNPLYSESFILAAIYCLGSASFSDLVHLVKYLDIEDKEDIIIIMRSTLTFLFKQRLLFLKNNEYFLTNDGRERHKYLLRRNYQQLITILDDIRVEVLNKKLRSNKALVSGSSS
ncbi:MAG: retron St85 family effector protein [bacterium]